MVNRYRPLFVCRSVSFIYLFISFIYFICLFVCLNGVVDGGVDTLPQEELENSSRTFELSEDEVPFGLFVVGPSLQPFGLKDDPRVVRG